MIYISYSFLVLCISIAWNLVRILVAYRQQKIVIRREFQLLPVYICLVVVARFTFFPFSRIDGVIQPLVLIKSKMLSPRINLIPFVHLFDYPVLREALLNLIGNITYRSNYFFVFTSPLNTTIKEEHLRLPAIEAFHMNL